MNIIETRYMKYVMTNAPTNTPGKPSIEWLANSATQPLSENLAGKNAPAQGVAPPPKSLVNI